MASLLTGYGLALVFFLALPWSSRLNRALATDRRRTRRTSLALGLVHSLALVLPIAAALLRPVPVADGKPAGMSMHNRAEAAGVRAASRPEQPSTRRAVVSTNRGPR